MHADFWKNKLASDSKDVVADLEALLRLKTEDLSEKGIEIRKRLNARLDKARQQLADIQGTIGEKACEGASSADETIRRNVYTSLGIAAAAGLLAGLLLGRR